MGSVNTNKQADMSFIDELKRRNVIRVAIAYAIAAWLLIEITATTFPILKLPEWSVTLVTVLVLIGFPLALIFAWAFELTPAGLKKEKDVDRSESITHVTGRKLDFAIIGVLAVALFFFASAHQWGSEKESANSTDTAKLGAQSIAILPFVNRSNRDEDLFFTDGIHDDLLTQLAKINDLKVISRTSVMHYRNTDMRIPQIAQELGVATVLEGGVQRAGQRIRINAQLIDVATDRHIWAETFDREMTIDNLFDIQTEITRQIVTAVRGQLTTEEQQAFMGAPTQSLEAYEAYLRARNLLTSSGYNMDKYEAAQPYAEQAVALDPDFAIAHWFVGQNYARQGLYSEAVPHYEQAVMRDESPYLMGLLGFAYAKSGRVDEAHSVLERLDELAATRYVSPIQRAEVYAGLGDLDRSFELMERAYEERAGELTRLRHFQWVEDVEQDPRFAELLRRIGIEQ